jgi:outer membrane phospholipase A
MFIALSFTVTNPSRAADWLLAAPAPHVVPGQTFEVVVIGEPEGARWPGRLPAMIELSGKGLQMALELTAVGEPGPARQRYLGQWPGEVVGLVTLTLPDASSARLLLEAAPAALPEGPSPGTAQTLPPALTLATESALIPPAAAEDTVVEPSALGFHEPIYILYGGTHPKSARYQLSFRYRLFDKRGVVAENLPAVGGLYFAFTQTSMWDLESESKPFRDTSFRPSLFLQWKATEARHGHSLTLAGGYEHESNGRDGAESRSINTLFLRAASRYYLPDDKTYIGIEPKVWAYTNRDENPDIARYRGYGQLGLRIGRDSALMLTAILRRGTAGVGSTQLDLSYPVRKSIFSGVGTFLHLQYFNGYGQTLLEYNESRHPQFRFGVSLVR